MHAWTVHTRDLERLLTFYSSIGCPVTSEGCVEIGQLRVRFSELAGTPPGPLNAKFRLKDLSTFKRLLRRAAVNYEPDGWSLMIDGAIVVRDPDNNRLQFSQQRSDDELQRWRTRSVAAGVRACAQLLERVDAQRIPKRGREIRLFAALRNEELRLPYFLEYHRSLGVDRFFIIDNESSDGTPEILRNADDVHVFRTGDEYCHQHLWLLSLLRRYGRGYWCLVLDADELFAFPDCEHRRIPDLCQFLDAHGYDALQTLLLDLYPKTALRDAGYLAGTDPREVARWFDVSHNATQWPSAYQNKRSPPDVPVGGVRARVFGIAPCLSKLPLLRYRPRMIISPGVHLVQGATVAPMRGVSLHIKFLQDSPAAFVREAGRGVHFNDAVQYRAYARTLTDTPDLSLFSASSVELDDSRQLLKLGIMRGMKGWS